MAIPEFNMRQLLEAGVHFGHKTSRWNPKMDPFIFGVRNGIHVIDLSQTVPLLHQALLAISHSVASGGRVLFVGTKRQASEIIAETATQCAQHYMNSRWLGGTLTNWKTISNSINRLSELEDLINLEGSVGLTKKELLQLTREYNKLNYAIGGVRNMGGIPNIIFVIDSNKEAIAVAEAKKLNIPIVAILDTNSDPDGIDYPIPGNDDARQAIDLYCQLISAAVIDGLEKSQIDKGIDIGEKDDSVIEEIEETEIPTNDETMVKPEEKIEILTKRKFSISKEENHSESSKESESVEEKTGIKNQS